MHIRHIHTHIHDNSYTHTVDTMASLPVLWSSCTSVKFSPREGDSIADLFPWGGGNWIAYGVIL